jgi:hypothetical protein
MKLLHIIGRLFGFGTSDLYLEITHNHFNDEWARRGEWMPKHDPEAQK